jgi:hypothetical protein
MIMGTISRTMPKRINSNWQQKNRMGNKAVEIRNEFAGEIAGGDNPGNCQ